MLATLMRGALLALDDAPAPLVAPLGVPAADPLLLAIVPVTSTRLSTWGVSSDAVPSSAYVRPAAAAPAPPAAPGVPAPAVPVALGGVAPDPPFIDASVRMNDATPEDDGAPAPGAPGAAGAPAALPELDALPRSRHPVHVIVWA